MSTPIVNQSENVMKIRVGTYHYVFSTEETNINSNARLITVAGLGGLRERDIVEISLAFFHPATPAQIKKGDVLKINDLGDVLVEILYAFEVVTRYSRATEGH
ncbi:hypothetical protein, partial [Pseudomonas viridiflava]|uniref:hypothetical protein n=1 Tax=Pseudomonas viridiflava TaxID=33069 RepID=UPI0013D1DD22